MGALYRVSTCHDSCRGGDHVLESLAGRSYNLCAASLSLARLGYYDEALNLVRSLGEVANLLLLLRKQPDLYPEWVNATRSERLTKFSPSGVRKAVENTGDPPAPMDKDWYSELCEASTHITPTTRPNAHNEGRRAFVGPVFQVQGLSNVVGQLGELSTAVAMLLSSMIDRDDLFAKVKQELERHVSSS